MMRYTALLLALFCLVPLSSTFAATNPIITENAKAGTTAWQSPELSVFQASRANGAGLEQTGAGAVISGYAGATSVNKGQSIDLHISTTRPTYRIEVYRMGWYGGTGARLITSISNLKGANRAIPAADPSTGLLAANWPTSYTLQTGTDWVSGVYLAKMVTDNGKAAYIIFVVRDDSSASDIVYQLPVATYQAYNYWGGESLYLGPAPVGRANKVSFDRPYSGWAGAGNFFDGDFNMIEYLESKGYNVSYITSVDMQASSSILNNHKVFLSNFHDEYWSLPMRNNLTAGLNKGMSLAFFGADTMDWQIRYENSASGTPNRVIVCYRDGSIDPIASQNPSLATVLWRNAPVNQPQNALLGSMFNGITGAFETPGYAWVVSDASSWVYGGTGLNNGDAIAGLVGNEWDGVFNNGSSPANLDVLSSSPVPGAGADDDDPGSIPSPGAPNDSSGTIYKAESGAWVFNASTLYWSWELGNNVYRSYGTDTRVQKMTSNILDGMLGVIPTPVSMKVFVLCASTGELCTPQFTTPVTTSSSLKITFAPTSSCSASRIHFFVDGVEKTVSPWLGWTGATGSFASLPLTTGAIDLSPVSKGTHTLGIEMEGEVSGCNAGTLVAWGGNLLIDASSTSTATSSPPSTPTQVTTTVPITDLCTSVGQLCTPMAMTQVTTLSILKVDFPVPGGFCSSGRFHFLVDGVEKTVSPWLGWTGATGSFATLPLDTGLIDLGPVTNGTHALGVEMEGQVSGCNAGTLVAWSGNLNVTTSR